MRVATLFVLSMALSAVYTQTPLASCTTTGSNGFILTSATVTAANAFGSCPAGYKLADIAFQAPDTAPYAALNFLQTCFGSSITSLKVFAHSYNGASVGNAAMVMWVNTNIPSITAFVPVDGPLVLYSLCQSISGGTVTPTGGVPCANPKTQNFETLLNDGNTSPTFVNFLRLNAYLAANIPIWGAAQTTTASVITPSGPEWIAILPTTSTGLPAYAFAEIDKPVSQTTFQIDKLSITAPFQPETITFKLYHPSSTDTVTFPNVGFFPTFINVATDIRFKNLVKVEIYHAGYSFGIDDLVWC